MLNTLAKEKEIVILHFYKNKHILALIVGRGVTRCLVAPGQKIFEAPPTSSKICFLNINPQLNYIINFTNAFDKVKLD